MPSSLPSPAAPPPTMAQLLFQHAGALGGVIAAPPPTMTPASASAFHTVPYSMVRPTILLPSNEADSESQTSEGSTRYRCRVYLFHSCCDSCRTWLCKRQVSVDVFATLITSSPSSSSRPLHPPGLFHRYRHRKAQLLPGASTPQRRTSGPLAAEQQEAFPVSATPPLNWLISRFGKSGRPHNTWPNNS